MSKTKASTKMVATKIKNKAVSCSTPENRSESPSRDSDSVYDSDCASPVPFLCTQDGVEGDTDVVWNYYTPKSEHAYKRCKNSTPLSRKERKAIRPKIKEKQILKKKPVKILHKNTELFQELVELNQKLPELIASKKHRTTTSHSGSEDDIFHASPDCSPKSGLRNTSRCLRKNVLSSKFSKAEQETALESDDSMNECLLKASQIVEENLIHTPSPQKKYHKSVNRQSFGQTEDFKGNHNFKIEQDSMDALFNSIKFESPALRRTRQYESPKLGNDSFDSLVGNLNDSALEQLTQMPIKNIVSAKCKLKDNKSDWTLQEMVVHDGSPSTKMFFGRHSSMPESPSFPETNKPSSSGMVFGRYNSMPYDKNAENITATGDSPIRCTPDEIKKKHQQAREKLLAKRQLPFTSQQQTQTEPAQKIEPRTKTRTKFQPKIPSALVNPASTNNALNIKLIIEKKRQEALVKLRKRQPK